MSRLSKLAMIIGAGALTALGQLAITTKSPMAPAVVGQPYQPFLLQTSGDPGPITWTISPISNSPPPGFSVQNAAPPDTTGLFCYGSPCTNTGVQTAPAVYNFSVTASSMSSGAQVTKSFTLTVTTQLVITTPSPFPAAVVGQPYTSVILQSSGDPGPITWSIADSQSPPPGFSVQDAQPPNTTGVFCYGNPCVADGVQTPPGVYTLTVTASSQNQTASKDFTIAVVTEPLLITTPSLPNAILNQPYSFQLQSSGTTKPIWSLVQAAPAAFLLSPGGVLSGVGLSAGKFSITIQLTDGAAAAGVAPTVTQTFPFNVILGPLGILELTLPPAAQNVPYSATLTGIGGLPPYTWSLANATTPPGLTIDPNLGTISGTPSTAGGFDLPVTVTDNAGQAFTRTFAFSVVRAVSITTTALPNGSPGTAYSATLVGTGGSIPYAWVVSAGTLPPGLKLNASTGLIDGTPTATGAFPFTIKVTDFSKGTSTKTFSITIGSALTITTTSLPGGALTQAYSQTLAAAGGIPPITWSVASGSLPAGLNLNGATGVISGTPTALGPASFTIRAVDAGQQTANQNLTVSVASAPLSISASGFVTVLGAAVSQTVTASGGVPPYTFSVFAGNLPGGVQLGASNGVLSGTTTAAGTFPVTLRVTDIDGRTADVSITITVNTVPVTIIVPGTVGSGQQPGITVSIPSAAAADVNGTLALAFASAAPPGTDNMVGFQNGSRLLNFTIPKGGTTSPNATVITGTVAGTITLTATVPGNADTIKTIVIDKAAPVINSVALQQGTGGVTVVVKGYSNTREVSSGSFTFAVSSGNTLSQSQVTVPLSPAFTTWFTNTTSNATGGLFQLTVPFSVTGNAAAITKVGVTLTNSVGTSAAASSP